MFTLTYHLDLNISMKLDEVLKEETQILLGFVPYLIDKLKIRKDRCNYNWDFI